MILGDIPQNATVETIDASVSFNSPTEIRGTTTTTVGGVSAGANGSFGGSYHLVAVDIDGNGTLDQWNYVGRAA
jgi:hypothetical protein